MNLFYIVFELDWISKESIFQNAVLMSEEPNAMPACKIVKFRSSGQCAFLSDAAVTHWVNTFGVCVAQQVVPQRAHRPAGRRLTEKSRQPRQLFGTTQQKERRRLLALRQVPVSEQKKNNPNTPPGWHTVTHWTQCSLKLCSNHTLFSNHSSFHCCV